MLLMCKDIAVYDIKTNTLLNAELAPGRLTVDASKENFKIWAQSRYSSGSNLAARGIQGAIFGQGNRPNIDRITRSFSLSDCYWLKDENDTTKFADRSPYCAPFWKSGTNYNGEATPTLYTDGQLTKWWENAEWLIKNTANPEIGRSAEETAQIEIDCYELCSQIGIPVNEIVRRDNQHIAIKNFTSIDIMLEQADTSGRLDAADFTHEDVIREFGEPGAFMLALDAIIGNTDRHTGNFGFLRDANTGKYLGMAPLYDFDWALNPKEVDYITITNAVASLRKSAWLDNCVKISETVTQIKTRDEFKYLADRLLNGLKTFETTIIQTDPYK